MSEWKTIKSVPQGEVILYFPPRKDLPAMMKIDNANGYPFRRPTHWQPLPSPPPPSGEGGK